MERVERVRRALAVPSYFHLAYIAPFDPNWERDDEKRLGPMPEFGTDMLRHVVRNTRSVVMLPPEFLKTTLLSQTLPLWLTYRAAYFNRQLRGLLMSEEEGMAAANLAVIQWHILNNDLLARDFADDQGRPIVHPSRTERVWREDAFVIGREHPTRDPTWQAKGLDSKGIHGRRLDWFLGDDLVTPRNAGSPAMRKNALDTFDLQVETRFVAGAKAVLAGNFNDPSDLLSTVSERRRWATFKRPSMHLVGKPSVAPKESQLKSDDAVPLWPENWTRARLLEEYEDKPNRFRRIHLLDPRAEWGEKLNVSWVTVIEPDTTPLRMCRFFMSIDPAPGGETDDLDYFNISVGALHDGNLDLVQSLDVRAPIPRQCQLVGVLHDTFHRLGQGVVAVGGQKVAMDRYFRGALVIARPDLEHKLNGVSVAGTKEERLEALGPYAQAGWLRVWREVWENLTSDPQDQPQELSLFEQWRDFPYCAHDDKLDGLDILVRTAQEFAVVGDVDWKMEVAEA